MAITYKSQGAGVSTETSGAALSPLCPATVDAGDILILHVFWEGTTTAPSPPGDWTILGSSPYVIETTIARHWVYGKIAAGTEDGAAVACGSPAVTTQRAARIYSFAGREGGTITELVTGFAHQSSATDPTFPSVTTTIAGALAVALVAQNDNNTLASATGESGGNWTEAVAEYTAALTPGFSLGIQTCTPTSDPGTVSGGTDNTTNDPVGVIGFQIKQNNNQSVTAGLGAITFTGFAPTVTATQNKNVTPNVGAITFTGFEPTVFATDNKNVSPGLGQITFEGLAPTVQIGINASPNLGEIVFNGFAPTIETPRNVSTGTGGLTFTGYAPNVVVTDHKNVSPNVGELTFTGFEPTISVSDHKNILPGLGEMTFTGFAPTVTIGSTGTEVTPGFGELLFEGYAPTVSVSSSVSVAPGFGELVFQGYAPTVAAGRKTYLRRGSKITNDKNNFSTVRDESRDSIIGNANLSSRVDVI